MSDNRPIYDHVETFERALNLYRGENFEQAAALVSDKAAISLYIYLLFVAWFD